GLDYLFLRKPFLRMFPTKEKPNNMLLLNMGGADSGNETEIILSQILEKGFSGKIVVVIGNSYPFRDSLESVVTANHFVTLKQGLSADEMHKTMSQCGVAILPPSTVALEFLSTGGLLFIKQTAANQDCVKEYLLNEKMAFDYSKFFEYVDVEITKSDNRTSFLSSNRSAFNGKSLHRVKELFDSLSVSTRMSFRKAITEDAKLTYNWAVDPEVRKYSYSKSEIVWKGHVQWFDKKISNDVCEYFIVEIDSNPIGQIRFDLSDDEPETYIVSYLMGKDWRGKGLGNSLLTKGIQNLMMERSTRKIIGYVQDSNIASVKAFDRAGFKRTVCLKYPDSSKFELLL
ncbi:MAG: bifunctional UDP-2,4-diacetamido-2,4,6-trideoxy-beta-L-altropyranose hydrolase/GNAT family N-acetyltransferase, partial [Cyclobacteriaceae bacterium]|nr:bifunctional UDP-2,4-diacetamido-2,4,6-trideoxy-beta-L-altropyranose hydrolase/GNAT family N-acetyltransferase [Cyclobacteriaceae bacterium]